MCVNLAESCMCVTSISNKLLIVSGGKAYGES